MKKSLIILLFPLSLFGQFTENVVNHKLIQTPVNDYFAYNVDGNVIGKRVPWTMWADVSAGQDIDIQILNIAANKKVYISWGDGNINRYVGNNVNFNHVYTYTGTYRIDILGDINDIIKFRMALNGAKLIDTITYTFFPPDALQFFLNSNRIRGSIPPLSSNITIAYYFENNQLSGALPDLSNISNLILFTCQDNSIESYDTLFCTNGALYFNFSNNNINSDSQIYEIFHDIDTCITVPTSNLTVNTSGGSMGSLLDETHSDSIIAKYTAAGKVATLIFNP